MISRSDSVRTDVSGSIRVSGTYRWMAVLLGWIALDFTMVARLAWGSVAVVASSSLGLPVLSLGVFVTAFFCGYVIANWLGGFLTDRVGSRLMLSGTMIALGCATFGFSMTPGIAVGMALQAVMGLAAGGDVAAAVKLITAWFDVKERGKAIGFLLTALPASVVITNACVPTLMHRFGWQAVYQIIGVAAVLFGIICLWAVRDGPNRDVSPAISTLRAGALLRHPQYVLLLVAGFGGYWGMWGFTFLVNALIVKRYGLSPAVAGSIVVWFGMTSLISKPVVGFISDFLGGIRRSIMLIIMVVFAALMITFGFLQTEHELMIGAAAIGFVSLAWSPLMTATIAEAGGKTGAGLSTGIANGLWQFAGAWSPAAAGLIFQWTHAFHAPFYLLAAGPVVAAFALLWVKDGFSVDQSARL